MTGSFYPSLAAFLRKARQVIGKGPAAVILVEDDTEVASTLRHHLKLGFCPVIAIMPEQISLPEDLTAQIVRVTHVVTHPETARHSLNQIIEMAPGAWLFYGFNAEYLFYPFCETRSIREMLAFHAGERRDAMLTFVIDLYAEDLDEAPNAVSLQRACLDRTGYCALAREDEKTGEPKERQLDFHGGLRWRYEEHVPETARTIDRVAIFKAKRGLELRPDHTFNDEEYNTVSCKWHNNLTAAICSFRAAKALKRNPASSAAITRFWCPRSVRFEWQSRQLMDLGLMEPGQWF